MKRDVTFLLIVGMLLSLTLSAQTYRTIKNGDYHDPSVWNLNAYPSYGGAMDSVIIAHKLTYNDHVDMRVQRCDYFTIKSNASLSTPVDSSVLFAKVGIAEINGSMSGNTFAYADGDTLFVNGNINFWNVATTDVSINEASGVINTDSAFANTGHFINRGLITGNAFGQTGNFSNNGVISFDVFSTAGVFSNKGDIVAQSAFANAGGQFTNEVGGRINSLANFSVLDTFTNNGDVTCQLFTNNGLYTGVSGRTCIATSFINMANISGSHDICDATPGTIGDINMGVIASTITYCQNGPCSVPTSVAESKVVDFKVYPNPSSGWMWIEADVPDLNVMVFNSTGQLVHHSTSKYRIDLTSLDAGIYLVVVNSGDKRIGTRRWIKN